MRKCCLWILLAATWFFYMKITRRLIRTYFITAWSKILWDHKNQHSSWWIRRKRCFMIVKLRLEIIAAIICNKSIRTSVLAFLHRVGLGTTVVNCAPYFFFVCVCVCVGISVMWTVKSSGRSHQAGRFETQQRAGCTSWTTTTGPHSSRTRVSQLTCT